MQPARFNIEIVRFNVEIVRFNVETARFNVATCLFKVEITGFNLGSDTGTNTLQTTDGSHVSYGGNASED